MKYEKASLAACSWQFVIFFSGRAWRALPSQPKPSLAPVLWQFVISVGCKAHSDIKFAYCTVQCPGVQESFRPSAITRRKRLSSSILNILKIGRRILIAPTSISKVIWSYYLANMKLYQGTTNDYICFPNSPKKLYAHCGWAPLLDTRIDSS